VTLKKQSSKQAVNPNSDLTKRGNGVIHVLTTDGFEDGEDGAVVYLTPTGLSVQGRITEPSLYNVFVPLDVLLEAWHRQNQEIAH
jgi:hypothetical protein